MPDINSARRVQEQIITQRGLIFLYTQYTTTTHIYIYPQTIPLTEKFVRSMYLHVLFAQLNLFSETIGNLSLIHISEPTRRTPISYAVFCLKKKKIQRLFFLDFRFFRCPLR
eukprot:TRINITY_DN369_c0_g1_i4.p1 TRINITY_DN369_c0_g1~~TRINITY_DN369_c0_g1_i4.p1  ORF type:complete len:112 (-),score=6.91 TRINITY_DN369_c0_g1_i4:14-349(-)